VDDVVHATLLAATASRASGRVYNIGRGRPTTFKEVVALLNAILGTRLPPLDVSRGPGEQRHDLLDSHKAEVELGFCPGTDLERALRRCVECSTAPREMATC